MRRILEMFGEPITYGGQESVVYNMLSSFNSYDKLSIDLFTPYFANNQELIDFVKKNGGNVYSLNLPFKTNDNRFKLTKYINDFFIKLCEGTNGLIYDTVHIHSGSLATMCVYSKAAKKHGVNNVIVHSHIAGFKKNAFNILKRYLLCNILKKYVNVYMACSQLALNSKFSNDCTSGAIIVNNGIDISKFKFNPDVREEIRNRYCVTNKFVIGSLGRLSIQKNLEFTIKVFAELHKSQNDIVLMIVGAGDEKYLSKLKELTSVLHCDEAVIFVGNQAETNKFYQAFDLFVLPSHYEGLPVTSIEAQISGLPTLISDYVTKECNISSGTKYLPINDAKLWATEILKIKDQVEVSKKQGNYRLDFDIDFSKFDRNITYKIIENLYLE